MTKINTNSPGISEPSCRKIRLFRSHHRILVPFILFGLSIQVLRATVTIEQAQRDIQARFYFLTGGNLLMWPPCRSGAPAPSYPPDGFYGNLDSDLSYAAYLVQDAANQFYG